MSAAKKARSEPADSALHAQVRGEEEDGTVHEVFRYAWWARHEGSTSTLDRTLETRRMALLYICKSNSDSLQRWATQSGKAWHTLFASEGAYSLNPNQPFELDSFVALSNDALAEYSDTVCNAFSRHKVESGVTYRYTSRASRTVGVDELLEVLRRDAADARTEQEHHQRQALLLSDIAGFD